MRKKITNEEINLKLIQRGITIVEEYINSYTPTKFICANGHSWRATTHNVVNHQKGCPQCDLNSRRLTESEGEARKEEINLKLNGRGIKIIGKYSNNRTKTEFICDYGHTWSTTPNSVNKGSGCPHCAKHGFNLSKSAYLYGIDFGNYIKYGITNNLKSRLGKHRRNGPYNILFTKLYETGHIAREVEKIIKCQLGGSFVTKETMPDGYTETLCITKLDLLMEIINNK